VDAADRESCRPDFAVALYPGHMLENTTNDFDLNPGVPVTSNTPPTFIVQAEDDPVDTVTNSLVYYLALKNARVPVEMHLYAQGGHGFGLRRTKLPVTEWPQLVETWLETIGMTPE
jgi:acetyl esterase/lipase